MIGLRYKLRYTPQRVQRATSRAERKQLYKAGAFVRRRAKSMIRKRKRISEPGEPPSSHTGHFRRRILFAFDDNTRSVVIGPTLRDANSDVPSLIERGGTVVRRTADGRVRRFDYEARPVMGPAGEAEAAESFPDLWHDSVREG